MEFKSEVIVHGIKESAGEYEGRAFSSCTFHCEVDLKENNAGRSLGRVTRPFKLGDAKEFDKWLGVASIFAAGGSVKAAATFTLEAGKDDSSKLTLIDIKPLAQAKQAA